MGAQNYTKLHPMCEHRDTIVKPVYGYVELHVLEDKPIISEYYDLSMPI